MRGCDLTAVSCAAANRVTMERTEMERVPTVVGENVNRTEFSRLTDWRLVRDRGCAWFDAPSQRAGAALVDRLIRTAPPGSRPDFDLRAGGVRVRIAPDPAAAHTISTVAADLGLPADPSALAELGLGFESADPIAVQSFWRNVLDYHELSVGRLADRLRRDPTVRFGRLIAPRPLGNRLHLDVGAPSARVDSVRESLGQRPHGPFGVALADADGTEVDLCPGGQLSPDPETRDWQTMFSALAFYPATDPDQASALTAVVAELADEAGRPLLVDVRPEGVMIDSGKDQWETMTGADPEFVQLAARIQSTARTLGLSADPTRYRFVQIGIAAVDIPALRSFWSQTLGYEYDPRPPVTDLYDPRRLNPVIFFQDLEGGDAEDRQQANRLHLELAVPSDRIEAVVQRGLAAGGRLVADQRSEVPYEATLADPEGNELRLIDS